MVFPWKWQMVHRYSSSNFHGVTIWWLFGDRHEWWGMHLILPPICDLVWCECWCIKAMNTTVGSSIYHQRIHLGKCSPTVTHLSDE
jgi:hypothetical protein